MKFIFALLFFFSFLGEAKMVSNEKILNTYNEQLQPTKKLLHEIQQTLVASEAIFELYKSLGYTTAEVMAVSRHFSILQEESNELYGDTSIKTTPFNSCASLASNAYSFWMAKLDSVKRDNLAILDSLGKSYVKLGKECVTAINTPPPKMIEESEGLQIIDIDPE